MNCPHCGEQLTETIVEVFANTVGEQTLSCPNHCYEYHFAYGAEEEHCSGGWIERLANQNRNLLDILAELDTWLHFKDEWEDDEEFAIESSGEGTDWRKTLAKACELLHGTQPKKQEETE